MTTEFISGEGRVETGSCDVTIAIPAYRHAQYLTECFSGILSSRRHDRIEVILIDDCSPDGTLAQARQLLEGSGVRFRIYHNRKNRGLSYGLRFLLAEASGRFFIPCASDDCLLAPAIDLLVEQIQAGHGPQSLQICSAEYFGSGSGPVYDAKRLQALVADTARFYRQLSIEFPRPLLLQSTVFNTGFLRRLAPWDDNLILDDWPTFLRSAGLALKEGLPVSFRADVMLTRYRAHSDGIHNNIDRQTRGCLEVVDKVVAAEFKPQARANVLSDLAAIHLYEGRYAEAARAYVQCVRAYPSLITALRLPLRAAASMPKRAMRLLGATCRYSC